jgi:hypothetical protein
MNRNYFWLTERQFARLEPLLPTDNRDLLSVLSDLRSLCILVWCFAKYDITDKRVGWVERSDTHQSHFIEMMGFAASTHRPESLLELRSFL